MKSKLGKNFSTGVIVLLITVCFIPVLALAGAPGDKRQDKGFDMKGHHGPVLGVWRNPEMVQALELTENQVKQIRDTDFTFREKHLVLKAQLDSVHLQLDKAFSSDRVDDTAVLKIAQAVSKVKGKLFVQNVESRLALGKILTAEQIKKMNLYDMQPKRKGPEQGRKHKMSDGSMESPCGEKPFED
jgi:Spy/CpxP family protein refolding chaperone